MAADLIALGNEIYVITGREDCVELRKELEACEMIYTGILSITSFRKEQGVPISYLEGRKSQPMMDTKVWNPTKAVLCATAGIDILIDDSTLYEPFFRDIKPQYMIFTAAVQQWLSILYYQGGRVV